MSTADQPHVAPTSTRLDTSQSDPLREAGDHEQGTVYPYTHPLPGLSQPPSGSQPSFTYPAFPSFTPAAYSMSSNNCFATYPGDGTVYPPALSMPPMWDPIAPMNYAHLQTPYYPVFNSPATTTMNAAASILASDNIAHEASASVQSAYSLLSQAVPLESQVKPEVQDTQEEVAVEAHQLGLGAVSNNGQSPMEIYAAELEKWTRMYNDFNLRLQIEYSSHGGVHLGVHNTFPAGYQDLFSAGPFGSFIGDTIAPVLYEGQSTTSQSSHVLVDSSDPLLSRHLSSFSSPALSESSMSSTSSMSAQASSSELSPSPPSYFAARSPLDAAKTSTSTRKQRGFVPYSVERQKKSKWCHYRKDDLVKIIQGALGSEARVNISKIPPNPQSWCLICEILTGPRRLSRKDALKRHIADVHGMFVALLDEITYKGLSLLTPWNTSGDLGPLIGCCMILQERARAQGLSIPQRHNLKKSYPVIAALVETLFPQ